MDLSCRSRNDGNEFPIRGEVPAVGVVRPDINLGYYTAWPLHRIEGYEIELSAGPTIGLPHPHSAIRQSSCSMAKSVFTVSRTYSTASGS
jgi:hypothetical protein